MIGGKPLRRLRSRSQSMPNSLARHVPEQHGVVGAAGEVGRQASARGRLVLGDRGRFETRVDVACQQPPEVVLVVNDQNPC